MSIKITKCDKCKSSNIKEINPENREINKTPLCIIKCKCLECGNEFDIKTWTMYGKRRGILY